MSFSTLGLVFMLAGLEWERQKSVRYFPELREKLDLFTLQAVRRIVAFAKSVKKTCFIKKIPAFSLSFLLYLLQIVEHFADRLKRFSRKNINKLENKVASEFLREIAKEQKRTKSGKNKIEDGG